MQHDNRIPICMNVADDITSTYAFWSCQVRPKHAAIRVGKPQKAQGCSVFNFLFISINMRSLPPSCCFWIYWLGLTFFCIRLSNPSLTLSTSLSSSWLASTNMLPINALWTAMRFVFEICATTMSPAVLAWPLARTAKRSRVWKIKHWLCGSFFMQARRFGGRVWLTSLVVPSATVLTNRSVSLGRVSVLIGSPFPFPLIGIHESKIQGKDITILTRREHNKFASTSNGLWLRAMAKKTRQQLEAELAQALSRAVCPKPLFSRFANRVSVQSTSPVCQARLALARMLRSLQDRAVSEAWMFNFSQLCSFVFVTPESAYLTGFWCYFSLRCRGRWWQSRVKCIAGARRSRMRCRASFRGLSKCSPLVVLWEVAVWLFYLKHAFAMCPSPNLNLCHTWCGIVS